MTAAESPEVIAKRLWRHVLIGDSRECWNWVGRNVHDGYGRIHWAGRQRGAHRAAWSLVHGDPGELWVLHRCDNRRCCNPAHLFLGTHADNMADMSLKGRGSAGDRKGTKNPRAKLADPDVRKIRDLLAAGLTQRAIAARFDVTQTIIYKIGKRELWGHVLQNG